MKRILKVTDLYKNKMILELLPELNIEKKDVRVIQNYNELSSLVKNNAILIVRNIKRPEKIRLVGQLYEDKGIFFIKGIDFTKNPKGKNKIIGKSYDRNLPANYGINEEEFITRHPVYITNPKKRAMILEDLTKMNSIPFNLNLGRFEENNKEVK